MDYQSKKDVNVAAEQAKMDAKLAQERAEESRKPRKELRRTVYDRILCL